MTPLVFTFSSCATPTPQGRFYDNNVTTWTFKNANNFLVGYSNIFSQIVWTDFAAYLEDEIDTAISTYLPGATSTIDAPALSIAFVASYSNFCSDITNLGYFLDEDATSKMGFNKMDDANTIDCYKTTFTGNTNKINSYISSKSLFTQRLLNKFVTLSQENENAIFNDVKTKFDIQGIINLYIEYTGNFLSVYPNLHDVIEIDVDEAPIPDGYFNIFAASIPTFFTGDLGAQFYLQYLKSIGDSWNLDIYGNKTSGSKSALGIDHTFTYNNSIWSSLELGDIIFWGMNNKYNIGHTAIYSGIKIDTLVNPGNNVYSILESASAGVEYGAIDDSSLSSISIFRINGLTPEQKNQVLNFCLNQINANYNVPLIITKGAYTSAPSWFCSELTWSAFNSINMNINDFDWNYTDILPSNPGATPQNLYHWMLANPELVTTIQD